MTASTASVALIELLMSLRARGIQSRRVLAAMERVPRGIFVGDRFSGEAYLDQALPIPCGQTISQPYIVAFMTEALDVDAGHNVLEVGTGSGYQTAILSHLAKHVVSIERYRTLKAEADLRFADLGLKNIETVLGDGGEGSSDQAPFDRIMVTAASQGIPQPLIDQLDEGGIMVMPLGGPHDIQDLIRVRKQNGQVLRESLAKVRFVPLLPGTAREL